MLISPRPGVILLTALLTACAAGPPAEPTKPVTVTEPLDELVTLRDALRKSESEPFVHVLGPVEPGWSATGVDLLELMDPAGPGAGKHLVIRGEGRVAFASYGTAPFADIPDSWQSLGRVPERRAWAGLRQYYFSFRGDNLVMVSAHPVWRIGKAMCVRNDGSSALFRMTRALQTRDDTAAIRRFPINVGNTRGVTTCYTTHVKASGGYATRAWDEKGHTLPEMNEFMAEEVLTIEPRGPIDGYRPAKNDAGD